ncbi:uncharacterized protein LOC135959026 [Calliphora vicina]|uniref:uncharacterized protein LOC135959026 n=1 Tax=Calliphora vicina TaxID=7373 RepID=UPI00325C2CA9
MEIYITILKHLVERRKRTKAECRNLCALNNESVVDISPEEQSVVIAEFLRCKKMVDDEQGKEFVCQKCFDKIKLANNNLKKIKESLKEFIVTKTPKKPKLKNHTNETKNDDEPTTSTVINRQNGNSFTGISPLEHNKRIAERKALLEEYEQQIANRQNGNSFTGISPLEHNKRIAERKALLEEYEQQIANRQNGNSFTGISPLEHNKRIAERKALLEEYEQQIANRQNGNSFTGISPLEHNKRIAERKALLEEYERNVNKNKHYS